MSFAISDHGLRCSVAAREFSSGFAGFGAAREAGSASHRSASVATGWSFNSSGSAYSGAGGCRADALKLRLAGPRLGWRRRSVAGSAFGGGALHNLPLEPTRVGRPPLAAQLQR